VLFFVKTCAKLFIAPLITYIPSSLSYIAVAFINLPLYLLLKPGSDFVDVDDVGDAACFGVDVDPIFLVATDDDALLLPMGEVGGVVFSFFVMGADFPFTGVATGVAAVLAFDTEIGEATGVAACNLVGVFSIDFVVVDDDNDDVSGMVKGFFVGVGLSLKIGSIASLKNSSSSSGRFSS
jgi:hypothetical protein